jgi:hypothetical protein
MRFALKARFAPASPLEGAGFEPSVPRLQWSSVQLAARDATDATPERRSFASKSSASDFRMPGAPFTWTKAGVELEIGFRDFEHLGVPFFAFSATFEICRDDRICHQGRIPNSGLKRDSLITSETSLIARFNSLQGRKKFPVRPIEGSACHITTMRTHPHAEATYRVVPLKDGTFGVEVVIPETYPTTVSAFATEAEAEAWIARHKSQVGSDISRQRVRKAGEDDPG